MPYRESSLTKLMKNYMSGKGQARACMIVNISKNSTFYDETFQALKWSAIASKVSYFKTTLCATTFYCKCGIIYLKEYQVQYCI